MKLFKNDYYANMGLADIRAKVAAGERLSFEDGVRLFNCPEPLAVGALAHQVRTRLHGDKAYYVLNRHVNYTNVCINRCVFCAYQREEGQQGGFVLTVDDVLSKIDAAPVTPREVHIVGGCHPMLALAYFEDVLNAVKTRLPGVVLKCFTAVEIAHFARLENLSTREVLSRLQKAGLDMLPGGGAEIFAPKIREQLCPRKSTAGRMAGHPRGSARTRIKTNCTMLFGHIEAIEDRVDHLVRLRESQDRGGGLHLLHPPALPDREQQTQDRPPLTGLEELRTIASPG